MSFGFFGGLLFSVFVDRLLFLFVLAIVGSCCCPKLALDCQFCTLVLLHLFLLF